VVIVGGGGDPRTRRCRQLAGGQANLMGPRCARTVNFLPGCHSAFGCLYGEVKHPAILELLQTCTRHAPRFHDRFRRHTGEGMQLKPHGASPTGNKILKSKAGDSWACFIAHGTCHDPPQCRPGHHGLTMVGPTGHWPLTGRGTVFWHQQEVAETHTQIDNDTASYQMFL
jgi:hypothetical protein